MHAVSAFIGVARETRSFLIHTQAVSSKVTLYTIPFVVVASIVEQSLKGITLFIYNHNLHISLKDKISLSFYFYFLGVPFLRNWNIH